VRSLKRLQKLNYQSIKKANYAKAQIVVADFALKRFYSSTFSLEEYLHAHPFTISNNLSTLKKLKWKK
jgi:hypothetical protein